MDPKIEIRKDLYEDGALEAERVVRIEADGAEVNHGPYVRWHQNGIKAEEGSYENGERVGRWRSWLETGQNFFDGDYLGNSATTLEAAENPDEPDAIEVFAGPPLQAGAGRVLMSEIAIVLIIAWLPHMMAVWTYLAEPRAVALSFAMEEANAGVHSLVVIAALVFIIARSGEGWGAFGFRKPNWILDSIVAFIGLLVLYEVDVRVAEHMGGWFRQEHFALPVSGLDWTILAIALLFNSFAEEIAMRAFLMRRTAQLTRSLSATLVVPAMLFASYHAIGGAGNVLVVFAWGIGAGLLYLWLRRIWPLVVMHTMHNLAVYALAAGIIS